MYKVLNTKIVKCPTPDYGTATLQISVVPDKSNPNPWLLKLVQEMSTEENIERRRTGADVIDEVIDALPSTDGAVHLMGEIGNVVKFPIAHVAYKVWEHGATIWGVVVHEHYRKQGVGKLMVDTAIAEIRKKHPDVTVSLQILISRPELINFYSKCGFAPPETVWLSNEVSSKQNS